MNKIGYLHDFLIILFASLLSVVGLHTFIYPAGFAAVGVDGIASMVQAITRISMGYIAMLINIPLLIVAWFFLNKKYVVYTLIFNILSSVMLILADKVNFYEYHTQYDVWISVVVSGILHGVRTGTMIKIGGSAGGVDIVASMIQKRKPYLNIENSISAICYLISGIAFFVYGNIESVILSILHMMVFNFAMASVMKSTRNAVNVTIITNEPQALERDILKELKHGATVVPCKGMYTDADRSMIMTVINTRQMNDLMKLSKKYPETFIFYNDVNGVWGNFRWNKSDPVA